MTNGEDILTKITALIKQERFEDASKEFFKNFEKEVVAYIKNRLGWDEDEAYSIFHDAYLLLQDKIIEAECNSITKLTVYQTCKYIGANKYRKALREKEKFNYYCEEERTQIFNELNAAYGLKLGIDDENFIGKQKKALMAFSLLKEQCQKILVMKYVDGLNHEEIIEKMPGLSNARVSITTLSRCIKKWKEYLMRLKNG